MEAAEEGGTVVVDFYHGLNRNGSRGRPSSCSRKDTGSKAGESVIESRIAGLGVHNKGEGGIEEGMRLLGCLLEFRDGQEAQPAGQARGATSSSSTCSLPLLSTSYGLVVYTLSTHSCRRPFRGHLSFYGVF